MALQVPVVHWGHHGPVARVGAGGDAVGGAAVREEEAAVIPEVAARSAFAAEIESRRAGDADSGVRGDLGAELVAQTPLRRALRPIVPRERRGRGVAVNHDRRLLT